MKQSFKTLIALPQRALLGAIAMSLIFGSVAPAQTANAENALEPTIESLLIVLQERNQVWEERKAVENALHQRASAAVVGSGDAIEPALAPKINWGVGLDNPTAGALNGVGPDVLVRVVRKAWEVTQKLSQHYYHVDENALVAGNAWRPVARRGPLDSVDDKHGIVTESNYRERVLQMIDEVAHWNAIKWPRHLTRVYRGISVIDDESGQDNVDITYAVTDAKTAKGETNYSWSPELEAASLQADTLLWSVEGHGFSGNYLDGFRTEFLAPEREGSIKLVTLKTKWNYDELSPESVSNAHFTQGGHLATGPEGVYNILVYDAPTIESVAEATPTQPTVIGDLYIDPEPEVTIPECVEWYHYLEPEVIDFAIKDNERPRWRESSPNGREFTYFSSISVPWVGYQWAYADWDGTGDPYWAIDLDGDFDETIVEAWGGYEGMPAAEFFGCSDVEPSLGEAETFSTQVDWQTGSRLSLEQFDCGLSGAKAEGDENLLFESYQTGDGSYRDGLHAFQANQGQDDKLNFYLFFPDFEEKIQETRFDTAAGIAGFGAMSMRDSNVLEWNLGPATKGALGNVKLDFEIGDNEVRLAGSTLGATTLSHPNGRLKEFTSYLGKVTIEQPSTSIGDDLSSPTITLTFHSSEKGRIFTCVISADYARTQLKVDVAQDGVISTFTHGIGQREVEVKKGAVMLSKWVGNCQNPDNFTLFSYKKGQQVAETVYTESIQADVTVATTVITDSNTQRSKTSVAEFADGLMHHTSTTDSFVPTENTEADYSEGLLVSSTGSLHGKELEVVRSLDGAGGVTTTSKLDQVDFSVTKLTYETPYKFTSNNLDATKTVLLDPNGSTLKEVSSGHGGTSTRTADLESQTVQMFSDLSRITQTIETATLGGLKKVETKRDQEVISSVEATGHHAVSGAPLIATDVINNIKSTRRFDQKGVSVGGKDGVGVGTVLKRDNQDNISELKVDGIDLTPSVEPDGTVSIGSGEHKVFTAQTDIFGTVLSASGGGTYGKPWSMAAGYDGSFTQTVDGRTITGSAGVSGDPEVSAGMGSKGGGSNIKAGNCPHSGNPCLIHTQTSGSGAGSFVSSITYVDSLGRVSAVKTPHPSSAASTGTDQGDESTMVTTAYTYDLPGRKTIITQPYPSPELTIQYEPDWQSGTVTGGGQSWEFSSTGTGKNLTEVLKLSGHEVLRTESNLKTGESSATPLGNEENKVSVTIDPANQKTTVEGPHRAKSVEQRVKGRVSSLEVNAGGESSMTVIEEDNLNRKRKISTRSSGGQGTLVAEISGQGEVENISAPGIDLQIDREEVDGGSKTTVTNRATGTSSSRAAAANGNPISYEAFGAVDRQYLVDEINNTITLSAATGQVMMQMSLMGHLMGKIYEHCQFAYVRFANGSIKEINAIGEGGDVAGSIKVVPDPVTGLPASIEAQTGERYADRSTTTRRPGTAQVDSATHKQGGTLTDAVQNHYDGLLLEKEEHTAGVIAGWSVRWERDEHNRPARRILSDGNDQHSINFEFDLDGRITGLSNHTGFRADYAYAPNTRRLTRLDRGGQVSTTYRRDQQGRLLQQATTGENVDFDYSYGYNRKSLRRRVRASEGPSWIYRYDSDGQLQDARSTTNGFASISYDHDAAGNRRALNPNSMNQYTVIHGDNGENIIVSGSVQPGATVEIAFGDTLPVTIEVDAIGNGSFAWSFPNPGSPTHLPMAIPVRVTATLEGAGDNGTDAVAELYRAGIAFPVESGTFSHDVWGNRTSDPYWIYRWDGFSRLEEVETHPDRAERDGTKVIVRSLYDQGGRRIKKIAKHYDLVDDAWVHDLTRNVTTTFIYENWDLLGEEITDANGGIRRRFYTWGLDIDGSTSGGGGTGGLIAIHEGSETYLPVSDGGGNITALLDGSTGAEITRYDRGPFGEPLSPATEDQKKCPFGFATHYTDAETGLVYFGYRWYDPQTGRFLSLEPLGDEASPNLYAYCHNDPVNKYDYLGLSEEEMAWFDGGGGKIFEWLFGGRVEVDRAASEELGTVTFAPVFEDGKIGGFYGGYAYGVSFGMAPILETNPSEMSSFGIGLGTIQGATASSTVAIGVAGEFAPFFTAQTFYRSTLWTAANPHKALIFGETGLDFMRGLAGDPSPGGVIPGYDINGPVVAGMRALKSTAGGRPLYHSIDPVFGTQPFHTQTRTAQEALEAAIINGERASNPLQKHHPTFKVFLRALHINGWKIRNPATGYLPPQRRSRLEIELHNGLEGTIHPGWNAFVKAKGLSGLEVLRTTTKDKMAAVLSSPGKPGGVSPGKLFDLLEEFYRTPAGRDEVSLQSVRRLREKLGFPKKTP